MNIPNIRNNYTVTDNGTGIVKLDLSTYNVPTQGIPETFTGVTMPISGVVITSRPAEKKEVLRCLSAIAEVEVHGDDEKGNLRKIEDEGAGWRVKSLMPDGTWQELTSWRLNGTAMDSGTPVLYGSDGGLYLTHTQYYKDTTMFRKLMYVEEK